MFNRILVAGALAASLCTPALAAEGPVGNRDFQCFALMATAEFGVRKQLDDASTPQDQRDGLTKAAMLLRAKGDWYLARLSTLPPEKRTLADFRKAREQNAAMDKDAFNALFDGCMKDATDDRQATLKRMME